MPNRYRFDIQQNSEEWFEIKLGKFSASTCPELLMAHSTKGYKGLINRIIEERITGKKSESSNFKGNWATERGHEYEPIAAEEFEYETFLDVDEVGVVELDDWTLCSPDRLIGGDGLLQIKCPIFNTQREYLRTQKVPTNYFKQMQFELFVTGRDYNYFYSYHPSLPSVMIKVTRDKQTLYEIETALAMAKAEVTAEINFLKSLK